jgi:uncharacterized protein YbcI
MDFTTRGEVEAALASALVQFEKDHLGKGPADTRVLIVENMILIRLRGTLTHVEGKLAQTQEGQALIRQLRMQILENARTLLEEIVYRLTGGCMTALYGDINVPEDERILVITVKENLEEQFKCKKERNRRAIPSDLPY